MVNSILSSLRSRKPVAFALSLEAGSGDATMINSMRLLLAICVLFASYVEPGELPGIDGTARLLLSAYVAYSAILWLLSAFNAPLLDARLFHWLDILWYGLFIAFTGGTSSVFFLFFFLAILTSSFRWGFEEGARTTIASVVMFAVAGILSESEPDLSRLLLRCAFMLALGYMCAYWGEIKLEDKRRIALLRDVTKLLNPRFGIDHTISSLLEKTKNFFQASTCILVMQKKGSSDYSLRASKDDGEEQSVDLHVSAKAVAPLVAYPARCVVLHTGSAWRASAFCSGSLEYDRNTEKWTGSDCRQGEHVAELLDARSFISAPVSLRSAQGRLYVISKERAFRKADALFLSHIVAQVFPFIENIEVLDRLASDSALQERQRISWDLHDTTIQPYIGLQLGLAAVRLKAAPDNPLSEDIDKLVSMTTQVIADLRRFASTFKKESEKTESVLLAAVRKKADQVREYYGIDIAVSVEDSLGASDRLTVEILQIVSEGLSNICKHTMARRGHIRIRISSEGMTVKIENDGAPAAAFVPRSITERVDALGGKTQVKQGKNGSTLVLVRIPV
jgi:signal transduction histidine kinase